MLFDKTKTGFPSSIPQIEPRLNAVGKDISIMLQPSDFIKELKRQLKAMKKMPYKDFLI
jgi:hypothetical protein